MVEPHMQTDTAGIDIANMRCWVLHDGRTGHLNQSIGVAEALGAVNPTVIPLEKTKSYWFWKLIDPARGWKVPSSPYPDLLIATGWQASHVSRLIKTLNPRTFTVQMMRPSGRMSDYDVVAMPLHDEPPAQDNVITTIGAPNRVSPERLKQEGDRWESRLLDCPSPRLAVLVGGETKGFPFGVAEAKQLAEDVLSLAKSRGYSLLVTTSRRTGNEAAEYLRKTFNESGLPVYYWTDSDPDRRDNPFLAYLSAAESVVVTADSISMISESCSAGRPVYVWGLDTIKRPKFNLFYGVLKKQRRIANFTGKATLRAPEYPLSDTEQVAGFVRGKLVRKSLDMDATLEL